MVFPLESSLDPEDHTLAIEFDETMGVLLRRGFKTVSMYQLVDPVIQIKVKNQTPENLETLFRPSSYTI